MVKIALLLVIVNFIVACNSEKGSSESTPTQVGNPYKTPEVLPPAEEPIPPNPYLTGITQITANFSNNCALSDSSEVYCWGMNIFGVIGTPKTENLIYEPTKVRGTTGNGYLNNIKFISAGFGHRNCAITLNGNVLCWGFLAEGIPENNTVSSTSIPVFIPDSEGEGYLSDIKQVAVGYDHNCALKTSGDVYCWGRGQRLGQTNSNDSNFPLKVRGLNGTGYLTNIIQISAGSYSTCALSNSGYVYCWGSSYLGDGKNAYSYAPVQVLGVNGVGLLNSIKQIHVGISNEVCAVSFAGELYCWGENLFGELGIGSTQTKLSPVKVLNESGNGFLQNISQVAVGGNNVCALTSIGQVLCWGENSLAIIGDGTTTNSYLPVKVRNPSNDGHLNNIRQISIGNMHACGLTTSNTMFCWGTNGHGQLGNKTISFTPTRVPVQVLAPSTN